MILLSLIAGFCTLQVRAETANFDKEKSSALPEGWKGGVTGSGMPRWEVSVDNSATSKPNVLKQSGQGDYLWCVKIDASLTDGFVEVKFRPVSGEDDQAGGIVWRWKDSKNYYIARGNALESNVSLYYMEKGKRKTLKYVDAPIGQNEWNTLRADFSGKRIRILLNGKTYIEMNDEHITGSGAVGVWTKADSVTLFDDFSYGSK